MARRRLPCCRSRSDWQQLKEQLARRTQGLRDLAEDLDVGSALSN